LFNLSRKVVGRSSEVLGKVVAEVEIAQEEKVDASKRNRGGYVASTTCPVSSEYVTPGPCSRAVGTLPPKVLIDKR
jgi:hypothetical protein